MNTVVRRLKSSIVGVSLSAVVLTLGAVTITATATASTPMVATTWVNMRSGPGTSHGVLALLSPQQEVSATGTVTNGWHQVVASGRTGWVYASYLKATGTPAPEAPTAPAATGTVTTTAAVNVRSGPGTSHAVVATVAKGTSLGTTGQKTSSWTQVVHAGVARWIASSYLTAGSVATAPVAGQLRTTANLYLRTGGTLSHPSTGVLPANSLVDTTGRTTADYTEISHQGALRWIATRYTAPVATATPVVSTAPKAVGTRYVSVGSLYLRATSAPDGRVVTTVSRGTALPITGVTSGDRTQVIWQGVARWAYTAYLSATAPSTTSVTIPAGVRSSGISQLNPYAKEVVNATLTTFPNIRTIYGWRASSAYSSDHPNGRAVDLMVSNWSTSSGSDYGWKVAKYFQANASRYHVKYIIWRQSSWNAAYPERGWRRMEDRGGATANHYDHVHVSVHAS